MDAGGSSEPSLPSAQRRKVVLRRGGVIVLALVAMVVVVAGMMVMPRANERDVALRWVRYAPLPGSRQMLAELVLTNGSDHRIEVMVIPMVGTNEDVPLLSREWSAGHWSSPRFQLDPGERAPSLRQLLPGQAFRVTTQVGPDHPRRQVGVPVLELAPGPPETMAAWVREGMKRFRRWTARQRPPISPIPFPEDHRQVWCETVLELPSPPPPRQ